METNGISKITGYAIVVTLFLISLAIIGAANKVSDIGRYQIVQREPNVVIMIDTKTGRCWEHNMSGGWREFSKSP